MKKLSKQKHGNITFLSVIGMLLYEYLIILVQLFKWITFPLLNVFSKLYIKEHYINLSDVDAISFLKTNHVNRRRLKILHLTDFHFDYYADPPDWLGSAGSYYTKMWACWYWLRRHVRYHKISKQQLKDILVEIEYIPNIDMIVLTGDFVDKFYKVDVDWVVDNFFSKLSKYSELGVFAVLGNHDESKTHPLDKEEVIKKLSRAVTILDAGSKANNHQFFAKVTKETKEFKFDIELWGFLDFYSPLYWDNYHKIVKEMNESPIKENTLRIVLSHNPDTVAWIKNDVFHFDLVLCGHTHGGQVTLPIPSIILKNVLGLFWKLSVKEATFDHFVQHHFSYEQVHQMNEGIFTYLPIIPIIIFIYKKVTLWKFVRQRISGLRIVQRLLNVCKYWEWGVGLYELRLQDDSTLIDSVLHHHKQQARNIDVVDSADDYQIKLIYRTYKIERRQFIHTSAGLGSHYPLRLFCPPEISILNLSF